MYSIVNPAVAGNLPSKNCSDLEAFWKYYNILQKHLWQSSFLATLQAGTYNNSQNI